MAKYGKKAHTKVKRAMDEMKQGKLKSGKSGKKVRDPKQAIAIGLSEARKEGGKVPGKGKSRSTKSSGTKKGKSRGSTKRSKRGSKGAAGSSKNHRGVLRSDKVVLPIRGREEKNNFRPRLSWE